MISLKKGGKRGSLFLLFALVFYGFILVAIFYHNENSVEYSKAEYQANLIDLVEEINTKEINNFENVEVVDEVSTDEGEVKGWWRKFVMGRCDAHFGIDEPQLFCGGSGGQTSAKVRLAEVFAPDILFIGAGAPFDNLVLTSNPPGRVSFRNASEVINPESDYLINQPPLPSSRANLLGDRQKHETFDMHYETVGVITEVEFDTFPGEKSLCPQVVNDGRFNVKGSNNVQIDATGMVTAPSMVQDGLGDRDVAARLCREDVRTIRLNEDESFLLCSEGFWAGLGCDIIETLKGPSCEDIYGVVIDAPLGSGEVCNENDCSIRYKEAGRLLTSPPPWADKLYPGALSGSEREKDYIIDDPVILETPCKVRIECKVCLTKCIWDISIWQHIYDLEKTYTYPGFKNAMSEDQYWKGVEDEIKIRARIQTKRW